MTQIRLQLMFTSNISLTLHGHCRCCWDGGGGDDPENSALKTKSFAKMFTINSFPLIGPQL